MRLSVEPLRARLRAPFAAAWGTITDRELLLVRLEAGDGAAGWGEAAPLPGYGGVAVSEVQGALDAYGRALAGAEGSRVELLAACAAASDLPAALAAVDMALWDLEGRRRGLPVWQLLTLEGAWDVTLAYREGYPKRCDVDVNATVTAEDPASVAATVAAARAAGFRCVKLKVAVGDDAARLAAARSAGGEQMAIRIDANGAWSTDQATDALEELAPFGIELCEEPVHGLAEIAEVAASSSIPIALDETAVVPGALERRFCDAACLKIAGSGGLTGLLERAAEARAAGYRLYFGSTLDGPLGIAAALHAAAAVGPELPSGLATLPVFADRADPLGARGGRITPRPGPGLGDGLLGWYA